MKRLINQKTRKGEIQIKKMIIIAIMAITFAFLITNHARAGVIEERILKQRWRIKQGILSGEIVRFEAKLLKQEQYRIKMAKRFARSDGRFTRKEHRRIMNMQNHASRHIYRLKHNKIRRHGRYHYSHWNKNEWAR
jgi:hypothetical protein